MIKPTVGRVILFYPHVSTLLACPIGEPVPALIARVWTDDCINIGGFDMNGKPFSEMSVRLIQEGCPTPKEGGYATWMKYQVGQAAKTEALEKEVEKLSS